ncbi:MAG: PAS domain-containing sensor histidine kinase [Methanothrix sp.]|nr:PAS domain-containing sensor histidine kinase [Methanothrix sp.]
MLDASIDPALACQIVSSLGQPVAASRIVDGKWIIEYANHAFARLLGVSVSEVMGKSFEEFMHPADIPRVQEGRAKRLRGITDSYEVRLRRKDGSTLPVLITAAPRFDGEKIVGSIYVLTDLTSHYSILRQLESSERRLRDILEFMPDPVAGIDREGRVIIWNRALENLTGVKKDQMLGKGDYECAIPFYGYRRPVLADLVLHGFDEFTAKEYRNLHREGNALTAEVFIPTFGPEGSHLWLKAAPVYDADGNVEGAIEIIRDITEWRRTEEELRRFKDSLEQMVRERTAELEKRNMEMERFVYTVSHDLRRPLITISGLAGLAELDLEKGDVEKARESLRTIIRSVENMDALLSDILELSRIGRVINPPEDVPFEILVKDAIDQLAEVIKKRYAEIKVAEGMPTVRVDRERLIEALVNLIDNSIKYTTKDKRPVIEIFCKDGVFCIRDNGIGIPENQREKVFELFYKVDPKSDGTGVGLTIVKRIIEVHGGRIWVESDGCSWTAFCFTLPVVLI